MRYVTVIGRFHYDTWFFTYCTNCQEKVMGQRICSPAFPIQSADHCWWFGKNAQLKYFLFVSETNLNFLSSMVTSSTECFVVKVMYNRWNFLSTQFICYILLFCSFHIFSNHTFLLKVLISLCTIKFCYSDDFSFSILMFRGIFNPEIYIHGALSWPPLTHFICWYSYSPNCSPYFPKVLTERICLTIRSFLNWWSFQTFLIGDTVRRNRAGLYKGLKGRGLISIFYLFM